VTCPEIALPRLHLLERSQLLPRPRAEVFAFFADPSNLERLTPSTLRFQILTPAPIAMRAGALIDYRLSLFGVPFAWQTEIEEYVPGRRFVDVQRKGPYAVWRHTHTFEEVAGGTRVVDRVEYALPLGLLGDLAHALFVSGQVAAIFDYRAEALAGLFGELGRVVPLTGSRSA
jgi:ligand-binding SRPBCC domain-containing protein